VARRAAQHLLRFAPDREDLLAAAVVALHGDDRGLAGDDPLALDVDERGRCAEIDREIVRKQAVEPVEDHRVASEVGAVLVRIGCNAARAWRGIVARAVNERSDPASLSDRSDLPVMTSTS